MMNDLCFTSLLAEVDTSAWGGGVAGLVGGICGAAYGSYRWIKNNTTGAEQRYLIRALVVSCLACIVLILVPFALSWLGVIPVWLALALLALCAVLAVPLTVWSNRRRAQLRGSQGPGAPLQG
jgi:hypothetical protein